MKFIKISVFPLLLTGIYLLICRFDIVNPYLIPRPGQLITALLSLTGRGILQHHIAVSLQRVFAGFFLTLLFALPMALFFHFYRRISAFLLGTLHFLRNTPPLAMVPLLILWFGIGEASKLVLIIMASFFPVFLNTLSGLQQVDSRLIEMGDTLELNRWEKIIHILLPEALPTVLTGMRLSFGYSWRALIGAEMIAASSGLGYMILDAQELARTDIVFIGILAIGLSGLLLDILFQRVIQHIFPWIPGEVI
ncbi:ABC transporter permease [Marispirochaeta aestuarii]|uniref:ABC transporter permease n=1 Tax=Marispirochaeta aestuarii TaxID=1963862 RepID=A0A1Y1S0M8_9SPIO|nr:ABC transporter permease [Marispirochaeta aestuarii]ORC36220.1 ABC transporter permease [Marispirochaeta aestuarii]